MNTCIAIIRDPYSDRKGEKCGAETVNSLLWCPRHHPCGQMADPGRMERAWKTRRANARREAEVRR